ncbi:MAG: hypothetical protein WDA53_06415 [Bacillota bacterium]
MLEPRCRIKRIILLAVVLWIFIGQAVYASQPEVLLNHLLIEPVEEGRLSITEQYRLLNPGEEAITKGELSFFLPQGAEEFTYGPGVEEVTTIISSDRIIFTQEFPPGETTLVFHYFLDSLGEDHFHLEREFNNNVQTFFIIVPAGALQVSGAGLADQGITSMGGRQLHVYSGSFNEGDQLSLVIHPGDGSFQGDMEGQGIGFVDRNIAPPLHSKAHVDGWNASPLRNVEPHLFMLVVVGLPLGILGRYLFKKGQLSEQNRLEQVQKGDFNELKIRENILKGKLIKLEQDFAQGIIEQSEYEARLAFYKKKLIEVRLQIEGR